MQHHVLLPQVELTMESVTVGPWLVKMGSRVEADQPLIEVETQKAVSEVPSPIGGYVRKLCVNLGDTIGEKALLCILTDTADEPFDAASGDGSSPAPSGAKAAPAAVPVEAPSNEGDGPVKASPAVRKLARELGMDLKGIQGTGPGGRITVEDVEKIRNAERGTRDGDGWKPLPASRVALNAQMQKSLSEIPQIHIVRQMNVAPLSEKVEGITFTHRLVRAVAAALVRHPGLRTVIDGERVKAEPVSVAIAMDTPHGLVAPALRDAEKLSLQQIASATRDFRARAEAGALKREELVNAPFAITNLGMLGVDFFQAFVFHGQTAVLAVGRSSQGRAWFSLAVDHRVVDGAEAARFLETLQKEISG